MLEKQAEDFRKMRSGDMKAFERLFVSLYPGLCNIANHYLNNEMLSKDVAQDAFIKWWNKREDFRDFAAVKSFLYITIRNQCLNYIRDHRKEVDLAGRFSEETDADFDLMVIEEEAIEALYSAIDRLPAQSARIMRLVVKGDKNLGNIGNRSYYCKNPEIQCFEYPSERIDRIVIVITCLV